MKNKSKVKKCKYNNKKMREKTYNHWRQLEIGKT